MSVSSELFEHHVFSANCVYSHQFVETLFSLFCKQTFFFVDSRETHITSHSFHSTENLFIFKHIHFYMQNYFCVSLARLVRMCNVQAISVSHTLSTLHVSNTQWIECLKIISFCGDIYSRKGNWLQQKKGEWGKVLITPFACFSLISKGILSPSPPFLCDLLHFYCIARLHYTMNIL
jgi:hypothetical protein